jgi:hypothetical protein
MCVDNFQLPGLVVSMNVSHGDWGDLGGLRVSVAHAAAYRGPSNGPPWPLGLPVDHRSKPAPRMAPPAGE